MTRAQQNIATAAIALGIGLCIVLVQHLAAPNAVLVLSAIWLMLVLVALARLQRLGIALLILDCSLQIDTYVRHDELDAQFGATSGFLISISTLVCLCFLLATFVRPLIAPGVGDNAVHANQDRDSRRMLYLMVLYCAIAGASIVVAANTLRVVYELWSLAQVLVAVCLLSRFVRSRADWLFVLQILLLGLLLQSVIMIALRVAGTGFSLGVLNGSIDLEGGMRVGGTLGSANSAGGFLSMSLLLGLGAAIAPLSKQIRVLAISAVLLGVIAIVLTLSRGSWLSLLTGVGVFIALGVAHRLIRPVAVGVALAASAALLLPLGGTIMDRLFEDDSGSALSRLPLNQVAWNVIGDHPVFGAGLNNFDITMQRYLGPDFTGIWQYTVHNRFLQIWSETGILGVLAFFSIMCVALWHGWKLLKDQDATVATLGLGLLASYCAVLAHMLAEAFDARGITTLIWLSAILLASARTCLTRIDSRANVHAGLSQ
jgi:putative inorganic carbon (hco3(-)) transporter